MSTNTSAVQDSIEREPTITRHVEPESQAVTMDEPATYFK